MNSSLEELRAEMRQLKELRRTIDTRIAWIHRRLYSPAVNGKVTVDSTLLIPHIQKAIDSGEALIVIAERCNLSEKTVLKALRGESISESSADSLITGLGIPHLYDDIVPMPPESHYYEE